MEPESPLSKKASISSSSDQQQQHQHQGATFDQQSQQNIMGSDGSRTVSQTQSPSKHPQQEKVSLFLYTFVVLY